VSRRDIVRALLPVAPPCFASRIEWAEYVTSAAEAQSEQGQPAPLIFEKGQPVRFNMNFDWCHDCDGIYAVVMKSQGRCKPDALKQATPKPLLQRLKELARAAS
jgi:hypothetical protein